MLLIYLSWLWEVLVMEFKKSEIKEINLEDLKFSFNLKKTDYKLDILQEKLLQSYLRYEPKFLRAFSTNYTTEFFQFLKDKATLKEPFHLSAMGQIRGGKSYAMITVCIYHQACYNKLFTIDYICANVFEFIEKLQSFTQDKLQDRIFLIDEEKQTVFGTGSTTKKMKIVDVQNIIAINNISTIMVNPVSWANKEAFYGLRVFGRCFNTKTSRFMLYNLTGGQSEEPIGMLYIPIFTEFLAKNISEKLEVEYLKKKNDWVMKEQRGEGDILSQIKKESAKNFIKDSQFMGLKAKDEKMVYISQKLGSEWAKGEIEEIFYITKLLEKGINLDR
jgi:hypothetical protein